jgi:hypothetical protein
MKALSQSLILNSFQTHCQFCKELGVELLKGNETAEQVEVLKESIEGMQKFIFLLEEKLKEKKYI